MRHDFRNYTDARLKPTRLTRLNLLALDIRKSELQLAVPFFPRDEPPTRIRLQIAQRKSPAFFASDLSF